MPEVEVRLVIEDYNARGRDVTTLWKRVMPMSFLPDEGDDMVMDDETDMSMTVRRRWWNPDGSSTVDLQKVYIDPPENIHRNMSPAKGITFWWTDRDGGDLPEILTRNGWSN